jgi:hypothetical protein
VSGYSLVRLANGACSIHSAEAGETFHPVAGPVAEAEALYVQQLQLPRRMAACAPEFVLWDVGLGAAGNSVTALRSTAHLVSPVRILSFDRTTEPLEFALKHADQLNYLHGYEDVLHRLLRDRVVRCVQTVDSMQPCHSDCSIPLSGRLVTWELHIGDFPQLLENASHSLRSGERRFTAPHAIFYDAFSPRRNPEMWTLPLLEAVAVHAVEPCSLATFSRSTITRTSLLLAGFYVGKGVALAGKEETTIASTEPSLLESPLAREWLDRARRSHSAEPLQSPVYQQNPLSSDTWERLNAHPQFR